MSNNGVVDALIDAGCVGTVDPFFDTTKWRTFKSGIQSPFYVDGRKLWASPLERELALSPLIDVVQNECREGVVLVGMATGGIPPAAMVAQRYRLPFAYMRAAEKGHGTAKLIEGMDLRGKNVLLVEDVVTLATTSLPAIRTLREAGAMVEGCFCFFTYAFPQTIGAFRGEEVKFLPASTLDAVVSELILAGKLGHDEGEYLLTDWREKPPMKSGVPPLW
jgi:orotate phosphoribosyltransferase